MPSDFMKKLFRYGEWSGAGWTAGRDEAPFQKEGFAPILMPKDREHNGVDAFDNYVSKAHDLNEVDAEDLLRLELGELDLIDNQEGTFQGTGVYLSRPVYSDEHRFMSYLHYRTRLDAAGGGENKRAKFAAAFVNYYVHILKSNGQFVIDHMKNRPSVSATGLSAVWMEAQHMGSCHFFLKESANIEKLVYSEIVADFGAAVLDEQRVADYLKENLIDPTMAEFTTLDSGAFQPTLSRDEMINIGRRNVVELFGAYVRDDTTPKPDGSKFNETLSAMRRDNELAQFALLEPQSTQPVARGPIDRKYR